MLLLLLLQDRGFLVTVTTQTFIRWYAVITRADHGLTIVPRSGKDWTGTDGACFMWLQRLTYQQTETPKLPLNGRSLIDTLDLAVGSPSPPRHIDAVSFWSSPELCVHSPVYGATVNTVSPVSDKILQRNSAQRSSGCRSLWKRSKRFVWRCMVNTALKICFFRVL
ncbi:hypothetical protein ACI65C_007783 [Semiaphis heraclei]